MDKLFKIGKGIFKDKTHGDGGGGGSGGFVPPAGGDGFAGSSAGGAPFGANMLFKQLDKNGDGQVTEEDFVLMVKSMGLGSIGDSVARMMFKQCDKNKNGRLEMQEVVVLLDKIKHLVSQKNSGNHGQY